MQKIILIILASIFLGCAKYQAPNLNITQKRFSVDIDGAIYLLYISKNDGYYFAIFDPFGAPQSSKVLKNGTFKSTKFLPKNSFYDQLFIESLDILQKNLKVKEFILDNKKIRMAEI